MADDLHYVPGDFYRICERTGFKVRASKTKKEWTGRFVRDKSFEMRHPQDFVRGAPDPQVAPDARPRLADQFVGPLETALASSASAGANTLTLASVSGMHNGDKISVMLDLKQFQSVTISSINTSTNQVTFSPALSYSAASGNLVVDFSQVTKANIG